LFKELFENSVFQKSREKSDAEKHGCDRLALIK
jgi:hypothetical protein